MTPELLAEIETILQDEAAYLFQDQDGYYTERASLVGKTTGKNDNLVYVFHDLNEIMVYTVKKTVEGWVAYLLDQPELGPFETEQECVDAVYWLSWNEGLFAEVVC